MRFIEFITEAKSASFILQPGLNPDFYEMPGNLANIERWTAITYNGRAKRVIRAGDGKREKIGYVMISKTDNRIIPMSRGDEHHRGYAELHDLAKIYDFKVADYVSVWAHGNNYIYNQSEVPIMLIAFKKYLSYGGKDGVLHGANDFKQMATSLSNFVKMNGNMRVEPDHLAPIGQHIIDAFHVLAEKLQTARNSDQRMVRAQAFREAITCHGVLRKYASLIPPADWDEFKAIPLTIKSLNKEDDVQGLSDLFFGFHSVKNHIHNLLRQMQERTAKGEHDVWHDDEYTAAFGNIDLAVDMLGRF